MAFTEQQVEDDCWAHEHRHRIERQLVRLSPEKLRQVAELIGYDPAEWER